MFDSENGNVKVDGDSITVIGAKKVQAVISTPHVGHAISHIIAAPSTSKNQSAKTMINDNMLQLETY